MFTDNLNNSNRPPSALKGFILDFSNIAQDVDLGMMTSGLNCDNPPSCIDEILDFKNWVLEDDKNSSDCCDADGINYTTAIPAPFTISIPFDFIRLVNGCFNHDSQTRYSGGRPVGGIYSGSGVIDDGNGATFRLDPKTVGVGTRTVTYTLNDKSLDASMEITIPVEIDVVGSDDVSCHGASNGFLFTNTRDGKRSYSYRWSNGTTSSTLNSVSGGTYSVTVTDKNGCKDSTTGSISEPTPLEVSITIDSHTKKGQGTGAATASATGGVPPYIYGWHQGKASATGLRAGTHEITVYDANNCEAKASVIIKEN